MLGKLFQKNSLNFVQILTCSVFCETWAKSNDEFSNSFEGFHAFSSYRQKRSKRGRAHGGTIVYVKESLLQGVKRISCNLDDVLLLLLDKKFFGLAKDVMFGSVYIPPEDSCEYNFRNIDNGIDKLQDELNDIVSKYEGDIDVVITGDFNSRTGKNYDFIIDDNSKTQPHIPECYENDSFVNQDKTKIML